jgi:D-lactate dehydrogenase
MQESYRVRFVNDVVDAEVIENWQKMVKIIALRCAGFNNVDLIAAQKLYKSMFDLFFRGCS